MFKLNVLVLFILLFKFRLFILFVLVLVLLLVLFIPKVLLLLSFVSLFKLNELLSFKRPNKSSNFFVGLISCFCSYCCWAFFLKFSASSLSLFFCCILKLDSYDKVDTNLFTIFIEASSAVWPFFITLFWFSSTASNSSSSTLLLSFIFKFVLLLLLFVFGTENISFKFEFIFGIFTFWFWFNICGFCFWSVFSLTSSKSSSSLLDVFLLVILAMLLVFILVFVDVDAFSLLIGIWFELLNLLLKSKLRFWFWLFCDGLDIILFILVWKL